MRSVEGQAIGLHKVAQLVGKAKCNCLLSYNPGDVVTLSAAGPARPTEVVYASDGYDIWRDGNLVQVELSAETAAQHVINEYRDWNRSTNGQA